MTFWKKYKLYLRIKHGHALLAEIEREVANHIDSTRPGKPNQPTTAAEIDTASAMFCDLVTARNKVLAELGRLRGEYRKIKLWGW